MCDRAATAASDVCGNKLNVLNVDRTDTLTFTWLEEIGKLGFGFGFIEPFYFIATFAIATRGMSN